MDVLRYLLTEWPLDLLVPVGAAAAAGAAGYLSQTICLTQLPYSDHILQ